MGVSAPRPGTSRVTTIPDDQSGISKEIGQMVEYVRGAPHDTDVIPLAKDVMLATSHLSYAHMQGGPEYQLAQLGVWFEWVKANYQYVSDPISYECSGST